MDSIAWKSWNFSYHFKAWEESCQWRCIFKAPSMEEDAAVNDIELPSICIDNFV